MTSPRGHRPPGPSPGAAQGLRRLGHPRPRLCRAGPHQGDPSRYPQAEKALDRSLALRPRTTTRRSPGRAALAAARHDFRGALRYADRALKENPYSERALAVPYRRPRRTRPLRRGVEGGRAGRPPPPRHPRLHPVRLRARAARRRRRPPAASWSRRSLGRHARRHRLRGHPARPTRLEPGRVRHRARHYARALAADETYLPRWRAAPAPRPRAATARRAVPGWKRSWPLPAARSARRARRAVRGRGGA